MGSRGSQPAGEKRSGMGPHDRFLELCAISTAGELTAEEQERLQTHLADCRTCRQALKDFEAAAAIGVPLLHAELTCMEVLEPGTVLTEAGNTVQSEASASSQTAQENQRLNDHSGLKFAHRNDRRLQVNWNYVWMPLAAAVLLTVALGIYSFQLGRQKGQANLRMAANAADVRLDALERSISDAGHDREALKAQLAARDRMIADLRRQIADQTAAVNAAKSVQIDLEHSLRGKEAESQQVAQERSALSLQLDAAQSSVEKTKAEIGSLRRERAQEQSRADSLEAQIRDLHGQLGDREQELSKQQELLAHDRDIRDLMGARDLYIAEVYDVARDGQTQKPYGRVFYTKGKSLIFYAYDLDQQAGLKTASTFQAWGSHGLDRQQATSLGVFYQDNLAKKRWVLKFDDAKKLEQIDAVFVTVEPNGGSHKPSGKQLLFAYLKVDPNHP